MTLAHGRPPTRVAQIHGHGRPEDGRKCPRAPDEERRPSLRSLPDRFERLRDRLKTILSDDAHVCQRRCARDVIHEGPRVASERSQRPDSVRDDGVNQHDSHDQGPDDQIRRGQRRDVEITQRPQLLINPHGYDCRQIAQDREDYHSDESCSECIANPALSRLRRT